MHSISNRKSALALGAAIAGLTMSGMAQAQSAGDQLIEEILVTATKREGGISVQDAGVAISAYGEDQIDALFMRDLKAIGFNAPNVQLEDVGTTRGVANFSIRGLGINSSIPSIDPTVGVFVDGMYLGLNAGVVFDTFDLEGVEVLRGPQGLLFGRNVTGGAVLLRSTRPTDTTTFNGRVAWETGNNRYLSGVISSPLTDSTRVKFGAYYNNDAGWFTNLANGNSSFGKADTKILRAAVDTDFSDNFNLIVRAEHGESDGDGPASQNGGLFSHQSFDFAIDVEGFYDNEWNHLIAEATLDVDFGDGQFVNILGWREYDSLTYGDIDATPTDLFSAPARTNQDQLSNELRYNGTFGKAYLTTGVYFFTQDVEYIEQRDLLQATPGAVTLVGGGIQAQDTSAVFASVDYEVSDLLTLNVGARYTREKKDARIATITVPAVISSGCNLLTGCSNYNFIDNHTWSNVTPKIGFQVTPDDDTQLYGFWTKGFRSGGYNLRHTSLTDPNERFDDEEQNSVELGVKKDMNDGRIRLNVAAFYNKIDNMQREVNLPSQAAGVIQLIKNTADATITGGEVEFTWVMSDDLMLQMNAGYAHGKYDEVRFDLNGDGVVNDADKQLTLPRLAPWSFGATLTWDKELAIGSLRTSLSGYHRDAAAYTDNNRGNLRESDMIDANISLRMMESRLILSLFGRNLKNEVTIGGDTQLPFFAGSTFSPLNKGKTYGLELQYRYE